MGTARKIVGASLGGGGAKGRFHDGVFHELATLLEAREGSQIDLFADFVTRCWNEISGNEDIFLKKWPWESCRSDSLLDTTPLRSYLTRTISFERAKTGTPVEFASVDVLSCRLVRHGSRDARNAEDLISRICASSSFPGGAFPHEDRGEEGLLSDGGLLTINPLSFAIKYGCTDILAVSCRNHEKPDVWTRADIKNPLDSARRHLDVMENGISERDFREVEWVNRLVEAGHPSAKDKRYVHVDAILPDEPLGSGLEFSKEASQRRFEAGRRACRDYFDQHPERLEVYRYGFHYGCGNSVGAVVVAGLTQFAPRPPET